MSQNTVLILSDDADFPRTLIGHWQAARAMPAFVVMGSDVSDGVPKASYDVAVVGPVRSGHLDSALAALDATGRPLLCVLAGRPPQKIRARFPHVVFVRLREEWPDIVIAVAGEILRRIDATVRVRRAEQAAAAGERDAAIGRYILEMRHSMNNALTSVLGNAELMLLAPGALPAETREQIETMHAMALRMHEIMRRLSSIESEMKMAERDARTGVVTHVPRVLAARQ